MLRDFLAGLSAEPRISGKGTSYGKAVPITKTGYNTEAERMANREKLRVACFAITADPTLKMKPDGTTFCNFGVQRVAAVMGCNSLRGLMANDMWYFMSNPLNGFSKDSGMRASIHAVRGGLAIAAKRYHPHGHVAVVAPEACQLSGSWGRLVPLCANVGRKNGIMKVSEAFPVDQGEPDYFLYGDV